MFHMAPSSTSRASPSIAQRNRISLLHAERLGQEGSNGGVISCATMEIIQVPATFTRSTAKYSPFRRRVRHDPLGLEASPLKPGTSKKAAQDQQGLHRGAGEHRRGLSVVPQPGARELATP